MGTKENIKNEDPNHVVNIGGHIKLKVLKAKNLKNTEMIGKSDPYVSIKYGNMISKSETKKNTLNPEWNWEASFVLDDVHSDIILSIFDSDQFGKDEKMGSIIFEKQSLKKYVSKEPIWINFTDNKPGQVLVFFDFNNEPEIEISKERKEEKNSIKNEAFDVEKNSQSNSDTIIKTQSKGTTDVKVEIEGEESLPEEKIKDEKHKIDTEKDVTKNKSQTSNQSNKVAIKLKEILSDEDNDGKNNAQEFSNENVNLKDPNVNVKSEESTKPEPNEGAIGLRNILTNESETEESSGSKTFADLNIEKKLETINQPKEKLEDKSGNDDVESFQKIIIQQIEKDNESKRDTLKSLENDENVQALKPAEESNAEMQKSKDGAVGLRELLQKEPVNEMDTNSNQKEQKNIPKEKTESKGKDNQKVTDELKSITETKQLSVEIVTHESGEGAKGLRNILKGKSNETVEITKEHLSVDDDRIEKKEKNS